MSILSADGLFEITDISFTPNVIVFGEQPSYSIKIKNKTGSKITKLCIRLSFLYPTASNWSSTKEVDIFGKLDTSSGWLEVVGSTSWANNKEQTFTGKIAFNPGSTPFFEGRVVPEGDLYGLSATIYYNASMSVFKHLDRSGVLYVIDARYAPSISKFAVERADINGNADDEGEYARTIMKIALKNSTYYNRMSLQLRYRDKVTGGNYTSIDMSSFIGQALTSDVVTTIRDVLFKKESDYELQLWFGDKYEYVTSPFTEPFPLPRSFANVHLSGRKNGGVCFGSFSKATDDNPLFQCYYPSEFEAGIRGGFTYESGEVKTGGKWIDGKEIHRYVFVGDSDAELPTLPFKIGTLISASGTLKGSDSSVRPIPYSYYGSSNWTACFYVDGNNKINLQLGSGYTGKQTLVIILEYTKEASA